MTATLTPRPPPWMEIAESLIGIREIPGERSNPLILQWVNDINAPKWYENDDQAWCALFVNKVCQASKLPLSGVGFSLLRARSFATWGIGLSTPALGAVLVFTRPGGDHVGFYLGERRADGAFRVLGGNQGNAVSATWIRQDRLTQMRWPPGIGRPSTGRVYLDASGALSHDEA